MSWKEEKIGSIVSIRKGKKVSRSFDKSSNNAVRYIQIGDLRNNDVIQYTDELKLVGVNKDDIIIAWDGSKAGTVGFRLKGIIGSTLARLSIRDEYINRVFPEYLGYYLQSQYDYFQRTNTGAAIPHVSKTALEKLKIPLPDLRTQQQIVAVLDKAQSLIHKREQSIQLLDELLKATFLDMFGEPDIDFPLKKLNHGIKLLGGYAFKSANFVNDGIPLIKIGTVNKGYFDTSTFSYLPKEFIESHERYVVHKDDLLITLTGTVGKDDFANLCFADSSFENYLLNQRVAKFEIDEKKYNKKFISSLLKHPKTKRILQKRSKGVRQANISNSDIETLNLIYPTIEQQNRFGDQIEKIEETKQKLTSALKKFNSLFQSLLQDAFEGKLKLEEDNFALQNAKKKVKWFDEQLNQIVENSAAAQLQKKLDQISGKFSALKRIDEIEQRLNKLKAPSLDKISELQQKLERMQTPNLNQIRSRDMIQKLEQDGLIKKVTDNKPFKLKSFEEFVKSQEEEKLKKQIQEDNDPVLRFIGEAQIGKATISNYSINVARVIYEYFGQKEFNLQALEDVLVNNYALAVRLSDLKKDLFKIFEEFITTKLNGFFAFDDMRSQMKKDLFNPSFELLQEFVETGLKNKKIQQRFITDFSDLGEKKTPKVLLDFASVIENYIKENSNRVYLILNLPDHEDK